MPIVSHKEDKKVYSCSICKREFGGNILMAESCEKTHNIVYIKAKPSDIKLLMQYIYTTNGDKKLLAKELMDELMLVVRKLV